ncbi:hypothetical protein BC828DRAFT_375912 [Blastocladiella britannica]|nr:hypothetical protein BC828DRAFT_375912 [Blastocladiella britannica]
MYAHYRKAQPTDADAPKYQQTSTAQQNDLNVMLICEYCRDPHPNLVEDFKQGDIVCGSCGTVFKDRIIDTRSEWRTFGGDEGGPDKSRVGDAENKLTGNVGLATKIGDGHRVGPGQKDMNRVHAKVAGKKNAKAYDEGCGYITRLAERLHVERAVSDAAKEFFLKMCDSMLPVAKATEVYAGAALLLGTRQFGVSVPLETIAQKLNISRIEFGRVILKLKRHNTDFNLSKADTADEGVRMVMEHGMPHWTAAVVMEVVVRAKDFPAVASRLPKTLMGAALFTVSHMIGQPKSLDEVAKSVKVSPQTLRGVYKVLYEHRASLISDEYLDRCDISKLRPM